MGMESVLARAKTINLFGNPFYLLARWRERMEVRAVSSLLHPVSLL